MKTVKIYTNENAVNFETANLQTTLTEVIAVKEHLISKNVLCSPETIKAACSRNFDLIIEDYIQIEKAKLTAFEKSFGVIALLTGKSDAKLAEHSEAFRAELVAELPKLSYLSMHYLEMINFDTLEIIPSYDKKYFEQKNSINVAPDAAKHQAQLVEALNYFAQDSDLDLGLLFTRLVNVKSFEREYSVNFDYFDFNKSIRNFVEQRLQNIEMYANR